MDDVDVKDLRRLLESQGIFLRLIQQHLKDHQLLSLPTSPPQQQKEEEDNQKLYLTRDQLASLLQ
jgi:hypothetical protein